MKATKLMVGTLLFSGGLVMAGSAGGPAPLKLANTSYVYQCAGNEQVQVQYVTTGEYRSDSPTFLVLTYKGQAYGLSQAVSASGTRYVGHSGMNKASGLEWWEHYNEGTLSSFKGDDASKAKPILKGCKIKL